MNWLDCVEHNEGIIAIFTETPSLIGVRLMQITLEQDGPALVARINLNDFPANPPKKWHDNGFNRVQLTLSFIAVKRLEIRDWGVDNLVNLEIVRDTDGIRMTADGPATSIRGDFGFCYLQRISAYCDGSRMDSTGSGQTAP